MFLCRFKGNFFTFIIYFKKFKAPSLTITPSVPNFISNLMQKMDITHFHLKTNYDLLLSHFSARHFSVCKRHLLEVFIFF